MDCETGYGVATGFEPKGETVRAISLPSPFGLSGEWILGLNVGVGGSSVMNDTSEGFCEY